MTYLKNLGVWFFITSGIMVLAIAAIGLNPFQAKLIAGIMIVVIGNLFIAGLTQALYYWKEIGTDYFKQREISLRPMSGFAEIVFYATFFILRPEIVIGYLVVKSIGRYAQDLEATSDKWEAASIFRIGIVLSFFVALVAAAVFDHSQLGEMIRHKANGLMTSTVR